MEKWENIIQYEKAFQMGTCSRNVDKKENFTI